ncbi:hypothetical protein I4U23_019320 [Adineta vaga]|nr:hypothetical protein I4U23_019320 [Adineta vaga]
MPKRTLAVRNKGTDHEQQQPSTIDKHSSVKRNNTDETVPANAKKPKVEEKVVDKENVPKRQARRNNKPKESKPVRSPSPPQPVKFIEPVVNEDLDTSDESDDDDDDEDFEGEDEQGQQTEAPPVRSTTADDDGKDHPTNKQYVIYEKLGPNKETFVVSKTARYWNKKYRKDVRNTSPDAFGMSIHNDFGCYGELEVVENCLLDLTKAVFIVQQGFMARLTYTRKPVDKVNYILGFRRLEALTLLLDYTNEISGIDDGERFNQIMRVIGACYVTILRGLLPQVMFQKIENIDRNLVRKLASISKEIPNFKQVLERALMLVICS